MQHQIRVRVLNRLAHAQKQRDPVLRIQIARVAPAGDRQAEDQLHRQIRRSIRGLPDIEHARDGRMLERGDDFALAQETLATARIEHGAPDDLERYLLLDLSIRALGPEHHAHATATEFLTQDVRPHAIADGDARSIDDGKRFVPQAIAVLCRMGMMAGVSREQGRERLREFGIVAAGRAQQLGLFGSTQADGLVEQNAETLPLRGIDAIGHAIP